MNMELTDGGRRRLLINLAAAPPSRSDSDSYGTIIDRSTFIDLARSTRLLRHVFRYRDVTLRTERIDAIARPCAIACVTRLLSRGTVTLEDRYDGRIAISFVECLRRILLYAWDVLSGPSIRRKIRTSITELEISASNKIPRAIPLAGPVLHLRTDLWLGEKTGGAIAHTAGIANAMAARGLAPIVLGYESNPILDRQVEERLLDPTQRFWDIPEMPAIAANAALEKNLNSIIAETRPSFIYHRYSAFSLAGISTAKRHALPLILEYNGSEVWIARHWGRPFRNEALAAHIEKAALFSADRIVSVSRPLTNELVSKGVPQERIVTVTNGVDTKRFHPGINGVTTRKRLGIEADETVIGFIGSFGPWHGVIELVNAFGELHVSNPDLATRTRLVLIGDGAQRPAVEQRIEMLDLRDLVVLTGTIPQQQAPDYLAAADILCAPHLPNADGSAFFGSPTKLFEYMAMGRCVIASRLDQLMRVLDHERTALLADPADVKSLASTLARAIKDTALRKRLGQAAREKAVERYDWRSILDVILNSS